MRFDKMLWMLGVSFVSLVCLGASDWPMWRYDMERSSASPHAIVKNPTLLWSRKLPAPRPAWPLGKAQRANFDASYEPVAMGKNIFIASQNDGTVTAYATDTGEMKWKFYTEGPVRFAPVCSNGKIYFGSDDGYLYCLESETGAMLWKTRGAPDDRPDYRQLGNDHLVSFWPVRGGPVIKDGVVYFGAGIWPIFGVFINAVDAETGKLKWRNGKVNSLLVTTWRPFFYQEGGMSPQGYFAINGDKLVVPNGRSMPAGVNLTNGELIRYSQCRRNGDSRVATHGDYGFFGTKGMIRLKDFKEVAHEVYDEVEHHGAPYAKIAPGLDASSAFENNKAYAQEKGSFFAYDISNVKLKPRGLAKSGRTLSGKPTINPPAWKPPVLWEVKSGARGYRSVVIKAGSRVYGSVGNKIIAVEESGGKQTVAWTKEINGTPLSMIAPDGKLFVATKEGWIHCFGEGKGVAKVFDAKIPPLKTKNKENKIKVEKILKSFGANAGYCIVMGLGDGTLIEEILKQTEFKILCVDADAEKVKSLRQNFEKAGLLGSRSEFFTADPLEFKFPPYIANIMIYQDKIDSLNEKKLKKLFNNLRPYGGTLCIDIPKSLTAKFKKTVDSARLPKMEFKSEGTLSFLVREGALPGSSDWTHESADAARTYCSRDKLVKSPLGVLWYGDNYIAMKQAGGLGARPQVAGGRVVVSSMRYSWKERDLSNSTIFFSAYDAYTGRFLWKKNIKCLWGHYNIATMPDIVYVVAGGDCILLDAATGKEIKRFVFNKKKGTTAKDIRVGEDVILIAFDYSTQDVLKGNSKKVWTYLHASGLRNSSNIVCLDRKTGKELWRREAVEDFSNHAIAIGAGLVFCVDSIPWVDFGKWGEKIKGLDEFESILYALEPRSGKVVWSVKYPTKFRGLSHVNVHNKMDWVAYSKESGILLCGRLRTTRAFEPKTGKLLWKSSPSEGGLPFIIRDDSFASFLSKKILYVHDIKNGKETKRFDIFKPYFGGCNSSIGSLDMLFVRLGSIYYFDTVKGKEYQLRNIRSGCLNGLIPADGLLNVPCYSEGCSCNYAVQTSFAMLHMPEVDKWTEAPFKPGGEPDLVKMEKIEDAGFLVQAEIERGVFSITFNGEKIISKDHWSSKLGDMKNCKIEIGESDPKTITLIAKNGNKRSISIVKDGEVSKCVINWDLTSKVNKGGRVELNFTDFVKKLDKIAVMPRSWSVNSRISSAKSKKNEKALAFFNKIKNDNYTLHASKIRGDGIEGLWNVPVKKLEFESKDKTKITFDFELKNEDGSPNKSSAVNDFLFQVNAPGVKFGRLTKGFGLKAGEKKHIEITIIAKKQ